MNNIHVIPREKDLKETLSLVEEYNLYFEYNEFFRPDVLEDKDEWNHFMKLYKGLNRDRSKDTLHGAFLDVTIHSDDKLIREASVKRVYQSMEAAAELGVKGVVFHTNSIPNFKTQSYEKSWIERNTAFYKDLINKYKGIDVYVENMFDTDSDLIYALGLEMANNESFGICLDYAHAGIFSTAPWEWFTKLSPYMKHMHINDNDLRVDTHEALGAGKVNWKVFAETLKGTGYEGSVLIEVTGYEKQKKSLDFMKKNGIFFE